MSKLTGLPIFSAVAFVASLFLITPQNIEAAAGRLSAYSQSSAHGGYKDAGGGVTTGVDRLAGYATGNCAHCHEQHASIDGSEPTPPAGSGPSQYMLFADLDANVFCNYCHDLTQSNGADNIEEQTAKITSAHRPSGSGIRNVLCHECHQDSHTPTRTAHTVGTNTVSGILSNIGQSGGAGFGVLPNYVAPAVPSPGNENLNTTTFSAKPLIDYEYELCLDCHGDRAGSGAFTLLPDISGQFNRFNPAVHPVATTGNYTNTAILGAPGVFFVVPWNNISSKMYCSDCHGSETPSDPTGPHGSDNQYMLKNFGPASSIDNLCDNCHITNIAGAQGGGQSAFDDNNSWPLTNPQGGLIGDHTYAGHIENGLAIPNGNPSGCVGCHGGLGDATLASNIHGANYMGNVNNGGTDTGSTRAFLFSPLITKNYYTTANGDTPGNRFCASTCHSGTGLTIGYRY